MSTTDPLAGFGTNVATQQRERVPGREDQVKNNAGGFVFQIGPISQFRRFLTIGTTGGTYYVGENELTKEAGNLVLELTKLPGTHKDAVDALVEISLAGRALKQNPTLFALAALCQHGETESKQYARKQITKVVRTGTHLFIFMRYLKQFGGINRGLRREIGKWYTEKSSDKLAYQLVKYRQREGYTHRDVLRLVHPKIELPAAWRDFDPENANGAEELEHYNGLTQELKTKRAAIDWAVRSSQVGAEDVGSLPNVIKGFEAVQDPGNRDDIPTILTTNSLPWEALPDSAMNDTKVWDKLLDNGMPLTALLRQLPRLTQLGMVPQMGGRTNEVVNALLDPEQLRKARIHPFQVLLALRTYQQGHGFKSSNTWDPSGKIVAALDEMFYLAFGNVEPTRVRRMDALDVSGSMGVSHAGNLPMSPREVSAAMAMVSVRTEPNQMTVGFTGRRGETFGGYYGRRAGDYNEDPSGLSNLPLHSRQSLIEVTRSISDLPFGRTDCALPMIVAKEKELLIDAFVIYTDNETWFGNVHPFQALKDYRQASGIDSKLVVVSITPTKFSIADPRDPGMLDISGFDSAVPNLISDFVKGDV